VRSDRWDRLAEELARVREFGDADREVQLQELESRDSELATEVRRLLASRALANDFLDPPGRREMEEPLRLLSLDFRGLKIGEFELVREIGRGAAGVVYLGEQPALKRKVAIKILVPQLTNAPRAQERFEREALAASRLRHPSIVSILAFGEVKGLLYLAMEYVEGRSLHQHIEELRIARENRGPTAMGALDLSAPAAAALLVAKLADALRYCHGEGVLHRDIKPHNILIDAQGQPRIVDFGLAKDVRLEGITEAGLVSGTLHYMSPEQAQARSNELDARTDVYSLGVVLYELLTLRRPLDAPTDSELLRKVLTTRPIPPHHIDERIPKALSAICMRALRKSPEGRYEDAGEFARDLRAYLAGHKLAIGARIWIEDAYRHVFIKRPWLAVTGLVVSVGLMIAVAPQALPSSAVRAGESDMRAKDRVPTYSDQFAPKPGETPEQEKYRLQALRSVLKYKQSQLPSTDPSLPGR
jgi:serine/threonine protein kinase